MIRCYILLLMLFCYCNNYVVESAAIPCDRIVCMHGGKCKHTTYGEPYCECPKSLKFYGKFCEMVHPDPCLGNNCSASNLEPFANCTYASFCKYVFRDDHCDEICNNEGCLFDGFDCQEKTPTKCPSEDYCLKEYGNGFCNPECNSAECGWDGGDCTSKKEELPDTLVLTLITDPKNFVENIASKLLITLSQLLHASVHYQLDSSGNPMIYEWNSLDGQGSLIPMNVRDVDSHSIKKRSVEYKKGVKVYLTLDVSVCQQLSSLGGVLQVNVEISEGNRKCFTATQSAADMLAADSTTKAFEDLNIGIADATVMPKPSPSSSNPLVYIIFAVIGTIILVAVLVNTASLRPVKRKFVTVRHVFFPPTSDELKNRDHYPQSYSSNQFDRESLMAGNNLSGSTALIPISHGLPGEPAAKRFREDQPPGEPVIVTPQRVFTKLHEHAASAEPITEQQIHELAICAAVKDPKNGQSCIHWAVESAVDKSDYHVIEDIKKLVAAGCPIDDVDDSGATALHLAVRNGRLEVATYLLGQIDVNIQDDDGRTALFDAVSTKSLEMVQKILSINNVDVNVLAYANDTPLIQCCRMCDNPEMLQIAKALLCHPNIQIDKTGVKSDLKYSGKTAIHEAAACNSIPILKLLINRGAILTAHDVHEQTPLFLAVQSNQIEAVKLLINHMRSSKIEINASNDCGETPLQIALSKGFIEIAEILKNAGAQMPIPACFQVMPSMEHPTFPKMKAIVGPSSAKPGIMQAANKKPTASKKRKSDNVDPVMQQQQQQQIPNNPLSQQQMMGFYPLNNPMVQMPQYAATAQMHPQMPQYPMAQFQNYQHQMRQQQQQISHQQQSQHPSQQQHQPRQYNPEYCHQQPPQPQQQIQMQQPPSNYSCSNPPSTATQLPQCSSTSPHISGDSAYGSPNTYQNSLTNTSGHSDTSSFASPPSSYDTGFWPNPSPDTTVSNASTTVITPTQPSYIQQVAPTKQEYPGYVDNHYSSVPPQYPQQQQQYWDGYHSHCHPNYSSLTSLQQQHYPTYSQPQIYYQNHHYSRPPHIPYPEATQPMMHRSASFAAFPSQ